MSNDKKLVEIYTEMMNIVHKVCEKQDDESLSTIDKAIEGARLAIIAKKMLTEEEVDRLALYLRRDLHDMAQFLEDDENDQPENWLSFDLHLAENRTWEMFLSVADKTRVELSTFNERLDNPGDYTAGEIVGLGTLECTSCGKRVHFYKPDIIPACDACQSTGYTRVAD